jgi:uncharacterized protein (DUF1800 family)
VAEITGRRRFAHLARRAGFGGRESQITNAMAFHPDEDTAFTLAVNNLLNDRTIDGQQGSEADDRSMDRVKNPADPQPGENPEVDDQGRPSNPGATVTPVAIWWLERMMKTKRQLRERMTFFWHDHFATGAQNESGILGATMLQQNQMLRANALGSWPQLLLNITKDPAMVIWLDLVLNKRGNPNENFAREFWELFSLGVGTPGDTDPNYTEQDIKESTRAFTGYTVDFANPNGSYNDPTRYRDPGTFRIDAGQHDTTPKTVFGQSVQTGDDVVSLTVARTRNGRFRTADFIAWKLWKYLVYPVNPTDTEVLQAANAFVNGGLSIMSLVEFILKSPQFCSAKAYRALYKSPVELGINASRVLGAERMSWLGMLYRLAECGQRVLYPPDVNGWPSGRNWINVSTLLRRWNMNADLLNRLGQAAPPPFNASVQPGGQPVSTLLAPYPTPEAKVDRLLFLLLENDVPAGTRDALLPYARQPQSDPDTYLRGLFNLVMALPQYELA